MASTSSNTGTTTIVRGIVRFYNADKKFGFAEVGGQRVFFHQSQCFEVDGTPEKPSFSDRHSDKAPAWWKGIRYPDEIILTVTAGPKGPMAAEWGYRPKRNWLQSLQHRGHLGRCADGHIRISWSRHEHDHAHRELLGRFTTAPILEQQGADPDEDPWLLTLEFDAYDGPHKGYGPPSGRIRQVIQLVRYGDGIEYPSDTVKISHYDADRQEWMIIRVYAAGHWFGWEPGNMYDRS